MDFEGLATSRITFGALGHDIGIASRCNKGRKEILMREEIIVNSARLDYSRPTDQRRNTEATLESSRLFAAIRRGSTIWPTHHLSPIVSRINYNRVIQDSKVLELLEQSTDHTVVLN